MPANPKTCLNCVHRRNDDCKLTGHRCFTETSSEQSNYCGKVARRFWEGISGLDLDEDWKTKYEAAAAQLARFAGRLELTTEQKLNLSIAVIGLKDALIQIASGGISDIHDAEAVAQEALREYQKAVKLEKTERPAVPTGPAE